MRSKFVIPRDTQESVSEAFSQIALRLNEHDVPLLQEMRSVRNIAEQTRCLYLEDKDTLCVYIKVNGRLYKFCSDDGSAPAPAAPAETERTYFHILE